MYLILWNPDSNEIYSLTQEEYDDTENNISSQVSELITEHDTEDLTALNLEIARIAEDFAAKPVERIN